MEHIIFFENKYIIVKKNIGESSEQCIERGYYIIECLKKNYTLEEALIMSNIWGNIKFHHCVYNDDIQKKILST